MPLHQMSLATHTCTHSHNHARTHSSSYSRAQTHPHSVAYVEHYNTFDVSGSDHFFAEEDFWCNDTTLDQIASNSTVGDGDDELHMRGFGGESNSTDDDE